MSETIFVCSNTSTWQGLDAGAAVDKYTEECGGSVPFYNYIFVIILVTFSALFSGLTLGLLGLDVNDLQIVIAGQDEESEYAKKIYPMRKRGNLLLCTLLLGNVAVNSYLSILLAEIATGTTGFLVSTALIVVFGEIIPQATCSRHALLIGAKTLWIVQIFLVVLFPITYPLSKILDRVLGAEMGTIYDNKELSKLVAMHADAADAELDKTEANMMTGALNLRNKTIADVMTSWQDVFTLSDDQHLDFAVLTEVFKSGHSRIPVLDRGDPNKISGVLFVKDLILLDPEDETPLQSILNSFGRQVPHHFTDVPLVQLLGEFVKGKSHMAIAMEVNDKDENRDPFYENVGLVTLEDIIEEILQAEIVDETDVFVDNEHKQVIPGRGAVDPLKVFGSRRQLPDSTGISPQEAQAVYFHLRGAVELFQKPESEISDAALKRLISRATVVEIVLDSKDGTAGNRDPTKDVTDGGLLIYKRGTPSQDFTLILDGKAEILAGRQKFRSESSRWTVLGTGALENITQSDSVESLQPFAPDFTASVIENSRILRISREHYLEALKEPNPPSRKQSARDMRSRSRSGGANDQRKQALSNASASKSNGQVTRTADVRLEVSPVPENVAAGAATNVDSSAPC